MRVVVKVATEALELDDGCLMNLEFRHGANNWMATVVPNRRMPGGLDRTFWRHGSTRWWVVPAALQPGDVIEMAGDVTNGKVKRYNRGHFLVVAITDVAITAARFDTIPSARGLLQMWAAYLDCGR